MKRRTVLLLIGIALMILTGCLPKTGTVSGQVTDVTGTPIPDVLVMVGNLSVKTSYEGYFSIPKIQQGAQMVKATKTGYRDYSNMIDVVARKGNLHNITMVPVGESGNLLGVVYDALSNTPIAGVTVKLGANTLSTDTQGRYRFLNIPPGQYSLEVSRTGFVTQTATTTIEVNVAKTVDFYLVSKTHGNVVGLIQDKHGVPLAGATISIGGKTTTSDQNGKYRIVSVEAGVKSISAEKVGYEKSSGQVTVQAGTEVQYHFTLAAVSTVKGYVTDGRGGPGLSGAQITFLSAATTTDSKGAFQFNVPHNIKGDLLVRKQNRGTVRVQDIKVADGELLHLEIPNQPLFHPKWSNNPPLISTTLQAGQRVEGTVPVRVQVAGDRSIVKIYVYFGGEQRFPMQAMADGTGNSVDFKLNTTLYPNGAQDMRVLAYDDNGNAALLRVPVEVNNLSIDPARPGDLQSLYITSFTFGQNIGFYRLQQDKFAAKQQRSIDPNLLQLQGQTIDLTAAPADANLFVVLEWDQVQGANGYSVYRSLDGTNYSQIGNVKGTEYHDFSAQLMVNQRIYYRVIPYNSVGVGQGKEFYVIPTAPFNIFLLTPSNQASDVPLTPKFTWELRSHMGFFEPAEYFSQITLYDDLGNELWQTMVNSKREIDYNSILQPRRVYSWDITQCYSDRIYENKSDPWITSRAISIAGPYSPGIPYGVGSANGAFIFTTTISN